MVYWMMIWIYLDMIYDDELEDAKGRLDMNRGPNTMHEDTRLGMFAKLFRFAKCTQSAWEPA